MKVMEKYNIDSFFYLWGDITIPLSNYLEMIGHCIENNIKFNGEISNKIITHFLKQHYDHTIVSRLKAI